MKHAGSNTLDRIEPLLDRLRSVPELKEPRRGVFYHAGRAFLHFHEDPDGIFADLRPQDEWLRLPVDSSDDQELLVDLAVHFVKASGRTAPKVFKLKRVQLPPRGSVDLQTKISLAVHSTRTPRTGTHPVDVIVNGAGQRIGAFEVVAARR